MRLALLSSLLAGSVLTACAATPKPELATPDKGEALPTQPAKPVIIASTPVPNPPERPLRRALPTAPVPVAGDPAARIARANAAARIQPTMSGYANALQIYSYSEGALFQVYATPGKVTDIVLEEGEALSGTGPVAAGDTTRWIIGDTVSGSGAGRRVHILVKPTRPDLQTNLVINTDRRTYHLELRSTASTYMPSVGWRYAKVQADSDEPPATPQPPAVADLNFAYRISGDRPAWRPVRVFDDGRQTFIEFPAAVAQSQMPPLFVGEAGQRATDLVNYRVQGRRIVVDRLFQRAELRLGDKRRQTAVRIEREAN